MTSPDSSDVQDRLQDPPDVEFERAKKKNHWLTLAIDQCPASVVVTDRRGKIEFVNSQFTRVTGYSSEEAIGRNPRFLKSGLTPAATYRALWDTVLRGETWHGELHNRRKNGEVYPDKVSISPVRDERGAIVHFVAVQEDVSHLRRAESALAVSEHRYRALLDNANDAIAVLSLDGVVLEVNQRWEKLLGVPRDRIVGKLFWSGQPPKISAASADRFRAAVAQGRGSSLGVEVRGPDSTTLYIDFSTSIVDLGPERVALSIGRDVTERRRSEQALRASEARFSRLSESGIIGILIADLAGHILEANDTFLRMIGYSREEMLSGATDWASITPPEWLPASLRAVEQLKKTGIAPPWEKEYQRKDGTRVPVLIGMAMIDDTRCITFVTDMTDQKRAEQQHLQSEARYRMLFDASPLPKWLYDLETQRFLEVNKAAVRGYGYSRDEFLAMTLKDIRPPEDVPKFLDDVAGTDPDAETVGIWRHRKKDGTLINAEVTAQAFMFGDRKCRLVVAQDVSERQRLEAQLHQSQKMEAVGRLAGGIAHDFNNMLAVILSHSRFVLDDLSARDPSRGDVEQIEKAGQRAAALTRQLLAFSRKQVLDPHPLDLNEVVSQMDKMLRRLIGEDIELRSVPAANLGAVSVDPGQIEQVLMNLVVNSRDAMPNGGKITIETANADIDQSFAKAHLGIKPGPHVMLAVSDTGTGMDPATQARVFEPFFTTKANGKGTGLGLSTVFGIVKQSGGGIWFYSEVGKGTTFKIYLPITGEDARSLANASAPAATLRGNETVLLVEDEEQVRNVAREVLSRNGYRVIEAKNAGEALLISETTTEPIPLLLSDVVMPHMSGPEVARRLTKTRPRMKVLCMSGYTDEAVVNHGLLGSGIAFLQKPFTPEGLARKVREVLDAPFGDLSK
jgi:two-component system, cell cycle sensor histidine kinase and response regulator CckA